MKSCVLTENFACDPSRLWLYLTKPTLNGWRTDVTAYEAGSDGLQATQTNRDGSSTELRFTRMEKPRCISGSFVNGKKNGSFTLILLGGGDATSLECTLEINGLGLFAKPKKLLEERMTMLHKAVGD